MVPGGRETARQTQRFNRRRRDERENRNS